MELGLVVGKNTIMSESKSADDDLTAVGFILMARTVGAAVTLEEGRYALSIITSELIGPTVS